MPSLLLITASSPEIRRTRRLSRSRVQAWWALPLNRAYAYRWRVAAAAAARPAPVAPPGSEMETA
jgi:hypothetical protein